jgi:transposase InsO family protein
VYVAFILDVYARVIVGWQIAGHLRTDLVIDALEKPATSTSASRTVQAARHQRQHQRPSPSVLPEGHRPRQALS